MKKYIAGISGSPRKNGNTDRAVKYSAASLAEKQGIEHIFMRISEADIRPCLGCRACMKTGDCVIQDDDFRRVFNLIENSSFAVIGSPVYWMAPPGQMKNFIDRTHAYYASPGKVSPSTVAGIISIAADGGFPGHESIMRSWLDYYGFKVAGFARVIAREKNDLDSGPGPRECLDRLVESILKEGARHEK